MMLLCGPDWMVAVSSEGGSSVFPRQLCAMSSAQCPAVGRWRPALHSVAYPAIVRAWGPVTTARDNAPCLGWDGLAAHHGVTRRGVNTSTELCGEAEACLQTLFCSHPSLSVLSQTVRSGHYNGVTQSSRGTGQM